MKTNYWGDSFKLDYENVKNHRHYIRKWTDNSWTNTWFGSRIYVLLLTGREIVREGLGALRNKK